MKEKVEIRDVEDLWEIHENPDGYFILKDDLEIHQYFSSRKNSIYNRIRERLGLETLFPLPKLRGTFDGNGNTIRGYHNQSEALFGSISSAGVIKNLNLVNSRVECERKSGEGDVVRTAGLVSVNYGEVVNCSVDVNIDAEGNYVGGLAGQNDGEIRDCYVSGCVSGWDSTGGVCGSNEGLIENCSFVFGNVIGFMGAGGLAGDNIRGKITKCSVISGEVSDGEKFGDSVTGGLVGWNEATLEDSYIYNSNCKHGLVVGKNKNGKVVNCFWNGSKPLVGSGIGRCEATRFKELSNVKQKILIGKI